MYISVGKQISDYTRQHSWRVCKCVPVCVCVRVFSTLSVGDEVCMINVRDGWGGVLREIIGEKEKNKINAY